MRNNVVAHSEVGVVIGFIRSRCRERKGEYQCKHQYPRNKPRQKTSASRFHTFTPFRFVLISGTKVPKNPKYIIIFLIIKVNRKWKTRKKTRKKTPSPDSEEVCTYKKQLKCDLVSYETVVIIKNTRNQNIFRFKVNDFPLRCDVVHASRLLKCDVTRRFSE